MKINIKNVGSINDFQYELRNGITLFCGPNNTGKTYAAYTIYSILKGFGKTSAEWISQHDFKNLIAKGVLTINPLKLSAKFSNDINSLLKKNLDADFDAPNSFFARSSLKIELTKKTAKSARPNAKRKLVVGKFEFEYFIENDLISIIFATKENSDRDEIPQHIIKDFLNQSISELYAENFLGRVFVFTAERSAINLFSRELSSSRNMLVDQLLSLNNGEKKKEINFLNFLGAKTKRYSLPIRDGLEIAEDLKEISKEIGPLSHLASRLEKEILGGELKIGESGELIYTPENSSGLRINLSASLVKSLSSLVVYLRHQARKGDLIIIDEPEMNLHPDNQRKIARFLCELTNSGVDVLVSTHSDYIIREINNSIILKNPKLNKIKEKYSFSDMELIEHSKVSVVLFCKEESPTHVEVNELGFSIESIDDVINSLNQLSEEIMMELE